jgi:hypothetical protein
MRKRNSPLVALGGDVHETPWWINQGSLQEHASDFSSRQNEIGGNENGITTGDAIEIVGLVADHLFKCRLVERR